MLDKTIVVFYIAVANIEPYDRGEYMSRTQEAIIGKTSEEDSEKMIRYFIPILEGDSRVECINTPIYVSEKQIYDDMVKKIEEIDNKLDKITSKMYPLTRKILLEKTIS